jgi:hypothetical protein
VQFMSNKLLIMKFSPVFCCFFIRSNYYHHQSIA